MTEVAGYDAKLHSYLVIMEHKDWHTPGFNIAFADGPKLWWNRPARLSKQACSATLKVGVGAVFAVALFYSLSYISQLMATAVMISLYG